MNRSQVARAALSTVGWAFEGDPPKEKKYVALAVPHTSNWDGILLLFLARSIGLPMRWMVKESVTQGPLGLLTRRLGAVPIDRSRHTNVVDQMVEEFQKRDEFVLFIPPEGTRTRTDYWKSGFYWIARGAGVPVVPGYLDFGRKRAGLGPPIALSGNVREDMDRIREFYRARDPKPHVPSDFGPIRLREEEIAR